LDLKNLEFFKLNNGLKCVLFKKNPVPIVNITITYKVGSKDENPEKKGIAHLFEHLMFEGSKNLDKGEFDKICSSIGGTNNAYTTYDSTSYYMNIPSSKLEIGLSLEAERLFNFIITNEALNNQKNVVIEEINQTVKDQPYGIYGDKLAEIAYSSNSPYSWEVHGSVSTVASVTTDDIYEFKNKYYNPSNATLVITGNFDTEEAKKLIKKYFDKKVQIFTSKRNSFNKKNLIFKSYTTFKDDIPFEATFIAFHCDGFIKNFFNISDIISVILGSGKSSRLYKSLIINHNSASSVNCYIDKKAYDSLMIFYALSNSINIDANTLASQIYEEINNFFIKPPSETEILKAKNIIKSNFYEELSDLVSLSDNLALHSLFYDNPLKLFEELDRIEKLNYNEIITSSKKLFKIKEGIRVDALLK